MSTLEIKNNNNNPIGTLGVRANNAAMTNGASSAKPVATNVPATFPTAIAIKTSIASIRKASEPAK